VVAFASLGSTHCRVGYEELAANDDTGTPGGDASATPAGGEASGGTTTTNGGSDSGLAGESPSGGTTADSTAGSAGTSIGGSPSTGGASASGAGGVGGSSSGQAGTAGTVSSMGCVTTADCTCATVNNHVYGFCKGALNWTEAEAQCQTQSMHLARIDTQSENQGLVLAGKSASAFANGFALIGANDRAVAGEWRWIDDTLFWQGGPSGAAVGGQYANWANSSPSASGIQQCAGLLDTGEWQVRSCTALEPYICE
jgi:Lectin C-type domain